MKSKIYARVNEAGMIIDYPVFDYVIKARGHLPSMYAVVDTSDKPEENEYQFVEETISYNPATNIVKVHYEVKDKGVDYIFDKLSSKVPDPEDPTNEEKSTSYVPTEEDLAKLQEGVVKKVEKELDALAQAKQYDNIVSLIGYINSTDAHFKAEAEYGNTIRSTIYRNLYTYLGKVLAKELPIPTSWDEVVTNANLPACNWDAYVAPNN